MISCGVCDEIFSRPSSFERHIANAVKKGDQCAQGRSVKKLCIKTICNRVVEDLSKDKEKEAVPKSSDLLLFSAIALIIKPFVREDESPQRYISIFSKYIRNSAIQFESKVRQNIFQYCELEAGVTEYYQSTTIGQIAGRTVSCKLRWVLRRTTCNTPRRLRDCKTQLVDDAPHGLDSGYEDLCVECKLDQ
jgi:hypothetical protein